MQTGFVIYNILSDKLPFPEKQAGLWGVSYIGILYNIIVFIIVLSEATGA